MNFLILDIYSQLKIYDFSKKHLIAYICLYCLYVYAIKMNKNS